MRNRTLIYGRGRDSWSYPASHVHNKTVYFLREGIYYSYSQEDYAGVVDRVLAEIATNPNYRQPHVGCETGVEVR